MKLTITIVLLIASAAFAQPQPQPQPRRPTPTPAPQPTTSNVQQTTGVKPTPVFTSGCGATVYISSKDYRECCLLCSVGDDSPSKTEIAEMEKLVEELRAKNPTLVNVDARTIINMQQKEAAAISTGGSSGHMSAFSGGRNRADTFFKRNQPKADAPAGGKTPTPGKAEFTGSSALPKI